MDQARAQLRFAQARVAVLVTADANGAPHAVPVTFVIEDRTLWTALDAKPKRGRRLRRLANIAANPAVSLLVQHWDEDWSELWWVRADGIATVHDDPATVTRVAALLREKYQQYQQVPIPGPVIEVAIRTWRSWSST